MASCGGALAWQRGNPPYRIFVPVKDFCVGESESDLPEGRDRLVISGRSIVRFWDKTRSKEEMLFSRKTSIALLTILGHHVTQGILRGIDRASIGIIQDLAGSREDNIA